VNHGDFIGIVGPNGCGKSTLLQLIIGLLTPDKGTIQLNSADLVRLSPRKIARKMAFVPQHTVVSHGFSALEIVLMGRFPYKSMAALENKTDLKIAREMLETTQSGHLENRRFDTLSGGEQQRVILASALAQEPSVLLLDEPTSSLDLYYQLHIFQTLHRLNHENKLTIITVIHDLNLAKRYCQKIWMLGPECPFTQGPPETILTPEKLESVFNVKMKSIESGWLIPELPEKSL